eukprot:3938127-Rhodomonas_salina.5
MQIGGFGAGLGEVVAALGGGGGGEGGGLRRECEGGRAAWPWQSRSCAAPPAPTRTLGALGTSSGSQLCNTSDGMRTLNQNMRTTTLLPEFK